MSVKILYNTETTNLDKEKSYLKMLLLKKKNRKWSHISPVPPGQDDY